MLKLKILTLEKRTWDKIQTGISNFQISDKSLINKNCHNLRTSNNIGIKLGSVTELDKENKTASKKLMVTSCWQILTSSFF